MARDNERTRRLRDACEGAIGRLEEREAREDNPDIFSELGEALFWLGALWDAAGQPKDPLLLGLRWARNRITHGVIVSAPTEWNYGTELGRWVIDRGRLGTASGHLFLPRDKVAIGAEDWSIQGQEQGYDSEVVGRYVLPLLRSALRFFDK